MRLSSINQAGIECLKTAALTATLITCFGISAKISVTVAFIAMETFAEIGKLSFRNLDRNALAILAGVFVVGQLIFLAVHLAERIVSVSDRLYDQPNA